MLPAPAFFEMPEPAHCSLTMSDLSTDSTLIFGPVPSRRLGRSLGINHIPPKTCSYACVYCQLGRTPRLQRRRETFYSPETIVAAAHAKIERAREQGERIDYLTLVPDGEPTLDRHLGDLLRALRSFGIPLAVISNTSLLDDSQVREALAQADWVSLKVDAADVDVWRRVDRPYRQVSLADILAGAQHFAYDFRGTLVTETMLVAGVNDANETLTTTSAFLATLHPNVAYLGIPTRPPAEPWVRAPDEAGLNQAYQHFAEALSRVELLNGYEGNAFAATGNPTNDLLSITAVHPMREDAVHALLARSKADWQVVQDLITRGELRSAVYHGQTFYLRRLGMKH